MLWNVGVSDGGSIKSILMVDDVGVGGRRRRGKLKWMG